MKTVIEQLAEFIKDSENSYTNNLWLQDDIMKVYVRKGRHMVYPGKLSTTLDIAAVEVDEDKQGQGYWTDFLDKAHEMNPWEATYVENTLNPVLATSLIRHGWMPVPGSFPESFFMPKDSAKYFDQQFLHQKFSKRNVY
jgi:hypothetical protein